MMALSCSFLQYRNITAYSTVSQKQDQRSSKILTFCNVTRNIRVISRMRNGFIRFECTKSRNKVSKRKVHNTKIILTCKWLLKLVSSPRTTCQSEMRTNVIFSCRSCRFPPAPCRFPSALSFSKRFSALFRA